VRLELLAFGFGVLLVVAGLNCLIYRNWWAEGTFKFHPVFSQKYWEIHYLIMGVVIIVTGIAFMVWGMLGAPKVFSPF
jgi:hypothetical protein